MKYRFIKLTLATLALAASGGYAQAATYTATSTAAATFAGLGSPDAGFTNIVAVDGFMSVTAANGLSIHRGLGFADAWIDSGIFVDRVNPAYGTTYQFGSGKAGFFGSFDMNPYSEDGTGVNAFENVNELNFTFYSGASSLGSYVLHRPTSNAGLTFDFGLRINGGSFDKFVVTSLGNGAGYPQETFSVSNIQFAAAVPEPETYAMLLAGLCAVGFMSRRRRIG